MKFNKFASLFLTLSVLGNFALPAVAADEIMVLPPVGDGMNQNQNYSPYVNNYSTPVLKGTVTTVPVGTKFEIITNSEITTKKNHVGEIFTATLNQPISMGSDIVVPAGSEVFGQVTYSEDAGRVGRNAIMEIKFTSVKPPYGHKIPMMGKIVTKDNTGVLRGGSLKQQLVKNVSSVAVTTVGGLAVGTGIGAIASEAGIGAAVGSITGGVVGLGYIIIRKGREVNMPIGTKMVIILEQPLTVGQ
ncbi:MAG: hypothetical protein A2039_04515 [Candidatus Melainabacteria bacterium GWA2_34_9]|nr:MAG: hypothetical protein A2039_04515 [Candidatus Melainabacteria bacterium GWA2_34_9]